jgi:hypothetical protein
MMRRFRTLPTLLIGGLLVSACAGAEEAMDDDSAPSQTAVASGDDLSCYIARGTPEEARQRPSPLRETEFTVGDSEGLLCYGAPSARGRDIMGALLVYGQPERIGANEPTTIHLSGPANVGGVALQPGSYSLYAIAGEDEWQFFLNSNWERWGIPIDESVRATEVGVFAAEPEPMDEYVETLQYRFEPMNDNTMGDMVLEWENTRVRFHIHPGM